MIIKNIYPAFVTNDPKSTLEVLEKIGYKVIHINEGVLDKENVEYVIEDANSNRMDVVYSKNIKNTRQSVRMNVDNFEEALNHFKNNGFEVLVGPDIKENYKCAFLKAANEFSILLYEHIK